FGSSGLPYITNASTERWQYTCL
ncbi:60S ribosomal protein L18, partial [Araneus ventricosus]